MPNGTKKEQGDNVDELKNSYRKFMIVCDSLSFMIRRGEIESGKPFMNRAEICEKYNISPVTAHRVQKELCKRGLLTARKGRPFIVNDPEHSVVNSLKELVFIRQVPTFESGYHSNAVFSGIRQTAEKNNIPCREIYLELLDKNSSKLDVTCDCSSDSGLILMPYRAIMVRGAGYFLKPHIQQVTVEFPLPGCSGTMIDIYDGVEQLLTCAKERGAKSVMFIAFGGTSFDPLADGTKLYYGRKVCEMLGLQFLQNVSDIMPSIQNDIEKNHPDAILFHDLASVGRKIADFRSFVNGYTPLLLAFSRKGDGNCDPEGMICYESDPAEQGKRAAEMLLAGMGCAHTYLTEYIKGKLSFFNS